MEKKVLLLHTIIMTTLSAVALEPPSSGPITIAHNQKPAVLRSAVSLGAPGDSSHHIIQVPVEGSLTSQFGPRKLKKGYRTRAHNGVDYRAPKGAHIVAAGAGSVIRSGWRGGYGRAVEIDHGQGLTTIYAHMDKTSVEPGQKVEPGTLIGKVGNTGRSTGPHLHFEVRQNNVPQDPHEYVRPQLWQKTAQVGQIRRFIWGSLENPGSDQRSARPSAG